MDQSRKSKDITSARYESCLSREMVRLGALFGDDGMAF